MNLKFLRTFVTIADNAGFARAATQLNLTQSAASRQIQALEEELGMLLFVRVGRSSRLTPEGEDLLLRSRRLLSDVEARGVDGRQIQIIPYDNKSSSADSVRAFQRAVSDDKVNCDLAVKSLSSPKPRTFIAGTPIVIVSGRAGPSSGG
jgi:hypothetical protein